jgi:23S rRNA (uracil1939-C5)-methyltransferase
VGRRKKNRQPVEVVLDRLEEKHTSGAAEDGKRWKVRGAPVGATVQAWPGRKQTARRVGIVAPAVDQVDPPCPAFGTCGGCQLQEMPLSAQRRHKQDLITRLVAGEVGLEGVRVHDLRGAPDAYGYRNKVELSWGTTRYAPEGTLHEAREAGTLDGSFLGFHPPGWFSRIVPLSRCELASEAMNRVLEHVSGLGLGPAWDTREHTGVWRHLVLRDAGTPDDPAVLVSLVTTSTAPEDEVRAVADGIAALEGVRSVLWVTTDRLSEVARGDLRAVLHGPETMDVRLGGVTLRLPHDAFFQVNSAGAEVLLETIAEALFPEGAVAPEDAGTLLDLYCGVGAIGLALADRFARVVGVELHEGAIESATANAAANGIAGEWRAGPVEDVLPELDVPSPRRIVVDPPRVGLHPRAARFLATADADVLVYVACGPKSLARDRPVLAEGGWRMTDLWSVDLFPQTHHGEAIARFVR